MSTATTRAFRQAASPEPAAATPLPDPAAEVLAEIHRELGPSAAAGMRAACDLIDRRLRHDPGTAHLAAFGGAFWTDTRALLAARIGADRRAAFFAALDRGERPSAPSADVEAAELLSLFAQAVGPALLERVEGGSRRLLERMEQDLGASEAARAALISGYVVSDRLAAPWQDTEAGIARLAGVIAEKRSALEALQAAIGQFPAALTREVSAALDEAGAEAIAEALYTMREPEPPPVDDLPATVQQEARRLAADLDDKARDLGLDPAEVAPAKESRLASFLGKFRAGREAAHREHDRRKSRYLPAVVDEIRSAATDPAKWAELVKLALDHPAAFPAGLAGRLIQAAVKAMVAIDSAVFLDFAHDG